MITPAQARILTAHSAYSAYPFGAILFASGEEVECVLLTSFPISHLERQSGWYSAASAGGVAAAAAAAARHITDSTSTIPEAGRLHHVDVLHSDPSAFLAALTISVVVDEIMFGQNKPSLLVIDWGKALLVLRTFYHESLPNNVSTF